MEAIEPLHTPQRPLGIVAAVLLMVTVPEAKVIWIPLPAVKTLSFVRVEFDEVTT